jgi:exopolysaccharide production protein ExoQ
MNVLSFVQNSFVVISLLLLSGGPHKVLQLAGATQSFQEGGSAVEQLMFLVIQGMALFAIAFNWQKTLKSLLQTDKIVLFLLFSLLAIVCLSAIWSGDPTTTIRRGLALVGTTIFGIFFATQYSFKEQIRLLFYTFSIAIILSFIFAIALPGYGKMTDLHEGAWRGIYLHKNGLGANMMLSATFFLILTKTGDRKQILYWVGFFLSVLLLLLSTSKSALVNFFVLFAFLQASFALRWQYELMVPCLLGSLTIVTALGVWLIDNYEKLLKALGKDPTLTGRTDMWPLVWEKIQANPWLGYGYNAFWRGYDSDAAYIWYTIGWEPTHPHNGFLELLLTFGVIGTTIHVLLYLITLFKTFIIIRFTGNVFYFWNLMFLIYTVLSNIAETKVLEYNSLSWVLFVMAIMTRANDFDIVINKR